MGTSRNKIAVIAALSVLWPTVALPQGGAGATGGLQFDIGISSSVKVDDNFTLKPVSTGTSTIFDNRFDFNLSSITGTQSLILRGSTVLRYAEFPGRSTSGLEDPTIRLNYSINNTNSRLAFDARYRKVDREFLDPFKVEQEEQQSTFLIEDGGTLTAKGAGLTYQTGINAPLGFTLALRHDDKRYANVTNPKLFDTDTNSADATVSLRVSPVTNVRLKAGVTKYTADDTGQTDRTTTDYSVGVVQDINPVLVLDAQLGFTKVDTDTTGGNSTKDGANAAVTLTQALRNGSVFGTVNSTLNQNGTRTTFRFGRDLQLKLGKIAGSVGATKGPSGGTQAVATLAYNVQMKSSDVSVTLNRSASTNNSNEDVLDTRLSVAYGFDIDASSRIDLSLNWGRSETAGIGAAPTIDRTTLRAAYTRALTPDWGLTGGVVLRHRKDSSVVGSAQSNSVFLTLDRRFSFRP